MSFKNLTLEQLAEGINRRNPMTIAPRVVKKWSDTGILEGLSAVGKEKMATLLENQAVEMLRNPSTYLNEAVSLSTGGASLASSGQVAGFQNVGFPMIRRIFAGLIANELVSVIPMNLPSSLLFYLDFTYGNNVGGDAGVNLTGTPSETYKSGDSVYNTPTGKGVRSGSLATGGQYNLVGSGYDRVHNRSLALIATDAGSWLSGSTWTAALAVKASNEFVGYNARFVDYDPQVETDLGTNALDYCFLFMSASELTSKITGADLTSLEQVTVTGLGGTPGGATAWGANYQGGAGVLNLRKATKRGNWNPGTGIFTPDALGGSHVLLAVGLSNTGAAPTVGNATTLAVTASAVLADSLSVNADGSSLVIPSFESDFGVTPSPAIPDVNFKVESVAVTAKTRKLRARWSPEASQDITAFYSIDVEQEMTNLMSELVTLDIDREILNDLLTQASAANYFWSAAPGRIVNKYTGSEGLRTNTLAPGPAFTGNLRDWYETLTATVTDVANVIHKKTLRGSGNFLVCSPEVGTILEHTTGYKASYKVDSDGQVSANMTVGAEAVGTINARYTVFIDPYFPVNKILVGRKGSNFLETGYIYSPYIPLILTPTIYGQDDFTPRRGIMSRYGKVMCRSDFYGTVTVLDMGIR